MKLSFLTLFLVFCASLVAVGQPFRSSPGDFYRLYFVDEDDGDYATVVTDRNILGRYNLDDSDDFTGGRDTSNPLTSSGGPFVPSGLLPSVLTITGENYQGHGPRRDLTIRAPDPGSSLANTSVAIANQNGYGVLTVDFSRGVGGFELVVAANFGPQPIDIFVNDNLMFQNVMVDRGSGTRLAVFETVSSPFTVSGPTIQSIGIRSMDATPYLTADGKVYSPALFTAEKAALRKKIRKLLKKSRKLKKKGDTRRARNLKRNARGHKFRLKALG